MPHEQQLDRTILHKITALGRSLRWRLVGEGLAWALVAIVAAVFVTLAIDWLMRFEARTIRLGIMLAAAGGVLYVAWRELMSPALVPMDTESLALLAESRFSQLQDRLISALQFQRRGDGRELGESPALIAATAREANTIAAGLNFQEIVERKNLHRAATVAAAAVLLLAGFTVWQRPVMGLWLQRNVLLRPVDWPQETYLQVLGGNEQGHFKIRRGGDLEVTVAARPGSVIPETVVVHASYPGGAEDSETLRAHEDGRFYWKLRNVTEPLRFYVTGGDDRLDRRNPHQVLIVQPPDLRGLAFRVQPPGYTGRDLRNVSASEGAIEAGAGWSVELLGNATKDLSAAEVRLDAPLLRTLEDLTGQLDRARRRQAARLARVRSPGPAEMSDGQADMLTVASLAERLTLAAGELAGQLAINPPDRDPATAGDANALARGFQRLEAGARELSGQFAAATTTQPAAEPAELMQRETRLLSGVQPLVAASESLLTRLRVIPLSVIPDGGEPSRLRRVYGRLDIWGANRSGQMTLSVVMTDTEGVRNDGVQYPVALLADIQPAVELARRGVGDSVTAEANLVMLLRAEDDYGLALPTVVAAAEREGAPAVRQPLEEINGLPFEDREEAAELAAPIALDLQQRPSLKLQPGDRLRVYVEVPDTLPAGLGGPNVGGRATVLVFRILSREDLLAELIRRQNELRIEFAQAVDLQETARAKSLGAVESLKAGRIAAETRRLIGESAKLQTSVSTECGNAAEKYRDILTEMINNRLAEPADVEAARQSIVLPLIELADQMKRLAAKLERSVEVEDIEDLTRIASTSAELQEQLRIQMEAVLKNMTETLTRQEVDKRLQQILGISRELLEEIEGIAEQELEGPTDPNRPE